MDFSFGRRRSRDEEGEDEKRSFKESFAGITEGGAKLFRRLSLSQDEEGASSIKDSITEGSSRLLGSLGAKKEGLFNGISGITNKFDQVLGNKGEELPGSTPPQLSPKSPPGSQQRTPDSAQRTPERKPSLTRGDGPPPRPPPIRQDSRSSLKGPPKPPPPKFNKAGANGNVKQYSVDSQPVSSPVQNENVVNQPSGPKRQVSLPAKCATDTEDGIGTGFMRTQPVSNQPPAPRTNPFEKTSPPPTFDQAQPGPPANQFTYDTNSIQQRTPAVGSDYNSQVNYGRSTNMNAPSSVLRGAPVGSSVGGLMAPQQDLLVITPTSQEQLPEPVEPRSTTRGQGDSDADSSATEGCDDIVDPSDFDIVDDSLDMFRTGSVGSDSDWTEPNENQMDPQTAECVIFMRHFVNKIFMPESGGITQADKSKFGQLCQGHLINSFLLAINLFLKKSLKRKETICLMLGAGRLWFSRYVTAQRTNSKKVPEQVFYQLVQHFAIALFECHHSEDYTPAKSLMNMCFTFYHEENKPGHPLFKHFLYSYLKEQPIWQSLRFWNAAFFDAVQCERSRKPVPTNREGSDARRDDKSFQQNITFGQLGFVTIFTQLQADTLREELFSLLIPLVNTKTFTCNMRAFGLGKELCYEFLRKQATIANLTDEQVRMVKENIDRWRD